MQKKKGIALVLSFALVACLAVAGTLAWLTAQTQEVKNTFTVGNVQIALDESVVDQYGVAQGGRTKTGSEYKLIPGHEYTKDPVVTVKAKSEECYVFVKVVNQLDDIEDPARDNIAAQMENNGWKPLTGEENVYYYDQKVATGNADTPITVFEMLYIDENADYTKLEANTTDTITIMAYAVQADGFADAAAAWDGAPTDWTNA